MDAASLGRFERIHDPFGMVLAQGTFRLLKRGIDRGYREVTRDLRGLWESWRWREQDSYRVRGQTRVRWHDARATVEEDLTRVPAMWADVMLESEERRIILDTKFYRHAFGGRMGGRKLHSANLYQLLTYLQNRQAALPDGPRHEGMLLYPAVGEAFAVTPPRKSADLATLTWIR